MMAKLPLRLIERNLGPADLWKDLTWLAIVEPHLEEELTTSGMGILIYDPPFVCG